MKEFNEYLDTAKTAFDKVAPGLLNPYFPAVVNLKNKINECWKVFTEIVTTKEPRPIRHPDNQIELMGSRSANPKAVVDYAQHIVDTFGAAECRGQIPQSEQENSARPGYLCGSRSCPRRSWFQGCTGFASCSGPGPRRPWFQGPSAYSGGSAASDGYTGSGHWSGPLGRRCP